MERTKWGMIVGGIILAIIIIAIIFFVVKRYKARRKTYESVVVGMTTSAPQNASTTQDAQIPAGATQYNTSNALVAGAGFQQPPAYQTYGNYPGGVYLNFFKNFLFAIF